MNINIYHIETIFQRFINFLSLQDVQTLLKYAEQTPGCQQFLARSSHLLNCSAEELENLIYKPGDEEDHLMFINVYLWQQKQGKINHQRRIKYYFQDFDNQLIIHRAMMENGYENIDNLPFVGFDGNLTSYRQEIDKYLHCYEFPDYNDDDYLGYLISILNVLGPQIHTYHQLDSINKFLNYILSHINIDMRLNWLQPGSFTIFLYDLGMSPEKTWPSYCYVVKNGCRSIYDFIAIFLGFKIYGNKVRQLWHPFDVYGGMDLIELLVGSSIPEKDR